MKPKISVIVPVYNVEKYLAQNADSLLRQTWQNLELIFVDDGSPDSSGQICDAYQQKDSRVKVIHKQNEGLGFARNSGLEIAEGDYVAFIDSDDYVDSDMLERLMKPILEDNADTVIGGFQRVNDLGEVLYLEQYQNRTFRGTEVFEKFLPKIFGSDPRKHDAFRMSVWNGIYSMDLIRKHNIRFPSERVMISEDLLFDFDYYKYAQSVAVIDSVAYCYRENPTSLTSKYRPTKLKMVTDLYLEMEKRIKDNYQDYAEPLHRLQTQYFINLRGCIKQETRKRTGKSIGENRKKIIELCNHPVVKKVSKSHPLNRLNLKQKVFVLLLRYRCAWLLSILAEFNMI